MVYFGNSHLEGKKSIEEILNVTKLNFVHFCQPTESKLAITIRALSIQRHPGYITRQPTSAEDQLALFHHLQNSGIKLSMETLRRIFFFIEEEKKKKKQTRPTCSEFKSEGP